MSVRPLRRWKTRERRRKRKFWELWREEKAQRERELRSLYYLTSQRRREGQPQSPRQHRRNLVLRFDDKRCVDVLNDNGKTKKTSSNVPSFAHDDEREEHCEVLQRLWTCWNQMIFVDEKKIDRQEIHERINKFGYSDRGKRLPRNLRSSGAPIFPFKTQIAVAMSDSSDRQQGDVGTLCYMAFVCFFCESLLFFSHFYYRSQTPSLSKENILEWFEKCLGPLLTPYPGPRSVVLLDNWPSHHRFLAPRLTKICNDRGAYLIWNCTCSPDMNPIEKFFDVLLADVSQEAVLLDRPVSKYDVFRSLLKIRMSIKSYRCVFFDPPTDSWMKPPRNHPVEE